MSKSTYIFLSLLVVLVLNFSGAFAKSLDEAATAQRVPGTVAPFTKPTGPSPPLPAAFSPPFNSITPVKLFDNLYFVGTTAVGSFVIDTGDGLIMLDTGCGEADAALMVADMKKLGLDPSRIKLLLISHEHFDHYGGIHYLKKNVCPKAKVAMSLIGWNMLQTVPMEWAYIGSRPQSVDIFLTDGMKLEVGNTTIQVVATPGHSPGCMSFIIPVKDNGKTHMAGIMGGSAVWLSQVEARQYKASIEYFKAFARAAKCDVGLGVHAKEADFTALRVRKSGEPNPLVIGTERFDTVYLQKYRDMYQYVINSGKMAPYPGYLMPPSKK